MKKILKVFSGILWVLMVSTVFLHSAVLLSADSFSDSLEQLEDKLDSDADEQVSTSNIGLEDNFMPAVIEFMMGTVGTIALIVMLYAWFRMISSQGDADQRENAKKMLIASIMGIVIMTLAYAIVNGILALDFN